jgi:transcription initiation factor TFIIF subunit beta
MTPKEYDLHINNREQRNTFVFSEKDLPGFKPQFMGRNRYNRSQPQDPLKKVDGKVEKQRRGGRTIPSMHACVDSVIHS